MKPKAIKSRRPRAVNDNNFLKQPKRQSLRGVNSKHRYEQSSQGSAMFSAPKTRRRYVQALFQIVLGFVITCIAVLLYMAATDQHNVLIDPLIPVIIISAVALLVMQFKS